MDANPKLLIVVTLIAALSACAVPWRTTQEPPPAVAPAPAASPPAATESKASPAPRETAPPEKAATDTSSGVVITPLTAPVTPPPESVPPMMPAQESAASPEIQAAPGVAPQASPVVTEAATPRKPATVVADNVPREFTVTVGKKDPSHPNYGRGHDIGFIVDGVQGKELVLTRGVTYTFLVNTNVQHDFYFTTSPAGRGVGTVTDGIKGQFTYRGVVSFTPGASTPAVMYYECRNHSYMGGKIHVVNAGDKVTIGAEQSARPAAPVEKIKVTEAEVKQKLMYAEMVISSSAPMKRVEASDDFQAKRFAAGAKEQLGKAKSALAGGDTAAAMEAVNEALRLMSAATRLVPDEASLVDYKARYSDLLDQVQGFDKSYKRNVARGVTPKSGKALDRAQFDSLMQEAKGLAAKEQYAEAVKPLQNANDMLTAALGALLESQTVVYDKNFATPQEEYEYELSRYTSYEELIPLAIEQRKPSEQTVGMMDVLAKRAKEIQLEAMGLAAKGDHKQAIMALQAATERLQRALRMAGVQ
jgi:tetratricopeptide (TPR) repeat protein